MLALALAAAACWAAVLLAPWRPWSARPHLDPDPSGAAPTQPVTVLIPARNEAALIGGTLAAVLDQGSALRALVVDDHSTDATAERARAVDPNRVQVLAADPLPAGWSGKLWALECGRRRVRTPWVLLLDADIELRPGVVGALQYKARHGNLALVSLMATLDQRGFWAGLLTPAFVYFFKLLYPFRLVNRLRYPVAGAAGGCMLLRTDVLEDIGGFAAVHDALIDDCALAAAVKNRGHPIWLGLSRAAVSRRATPRLRDLWMMVSRTAYVQLGRSPALLGLCTAAMLLVFAVPPAATLAGSGAARLLGLAGWAVMAASYLPVLGYYGRARVACVLLPFIGLLYLAMTWHSALRHWQGRGAVWKGRAYGAR